MKRAVLFGIFLSSFLADNSVNAQLRYAGLETNVLSGSSVLITKESVLAGVSGTTGVVSIVAAGVSETMPMRGALSIKKDGFLYRPPAGFTGLDTVGFLVADKAGNKTTAHVSVKVLPAKVDEVKE